MSDCCLLIVDDENDMRNGLKRMIERRFTNISVRTAHSAEHALEIIDQKLVNILLLDIQMPGMSGLELLKTVSHDHPGLTVIMMTGYGSIEIAVEAIKLGAYDFITKPFEKEIIFRVIQKSIERNQLLNENITLKKQVKKQSALEQFIGKSEPMTAFLKNIETIARSHYTTLVRGASGTGKELTARAIHQLSDRRDRSLVMVNCPAIPEHLLESELFGHKKGAFTGAINDQIGLFKEADGGTICLDEVGDIPLNVQSKLLRVLQEGEIKPLGATITSKIDVRVIALTNLNLETMIANREFREDLFYRLNVVTIQTPSLEEIADDIPLLINHFSRQVCTELNLEMKTFDQTALQSLMTQKWPGNVRELQNFIRRTIMFSPNNIISSEDIQPSTAKILKPVENTQTDFLSNGEICDYKTAKNQIVDTFTRSYISTLMTKTNGNVSQSAELSGISRTALQKILRRYDFDSSEFRKNTN